MDKNLVEADFPAVSATLSAAMANDATRQSMRFFASPDELYAWVGDEGKGFVENHFAGKLSVPFSMNDPERFAAFSVDGGSRVGLIAFKYRVGPAETAGERSAVALLVDAVWSKPQFLADTSKAGSMMMDAKHGLWNRAAERFERAPDQ